MNIPHIPIKIGDKINDGALEILKIIRPEWEHANVEFKLLTDGITNKLVGCKCKDHDVVETVLIRVYGNKTDLLIDRKAETRNIILLNKVGLAPCLYATFDNGLAYQFVPGCTLTDETVRQPEIYKLVAKHMAKLHKIKTNGINPPILWDKLQQFIKLVPDTFTNPDAHKRLIDSFYLRDFNPLYSRFEELIVSKTRIIEEIDELKAELIKLNNPVVFAHNDLLLGNVIYTKEKNCVTFIDYEYAALNYQGYDIGNHFAEFVGINNIDYNKYPNRQLQLNWLRYYLEEYRGDFDRNDLENLYVIVNKFALISHIFWGIWALIQAEHSYIDFDFLGYAAIRFNEYFDKKKQFLSLQLPN